MAEYRPWTAKDVERLLAWHRSGVPLVECAGRLGRTKNAVSEQWRKHGEPRRRQALTAEIERRLRLFHARGWPTMRIAHHLGLAHSSVQGWMIRLGLVANGHDAESWRQLRQSARENGDGGAGLAHARQQEALAMGWPEARTPQEARVLALLEQAPRTEREIAEALGYRMRDSWQSDAARAHLARLRALRMVEVGTRPNGKGRPANEYRLAAWLALRRRVET